MYPKVLLILWAAALLPAQTQISRMEEVGKDNLPAQILGIDDLVAISVYDAPELTRTVRIESDGTVHLPLLKNGVQAAGELPRMLEGAVARALVEEQILVDPVVKVTVVEYHSRPISVMGAVKKPLTFQSVGTVTLLDALARAEGLSTEAGTEILLSIPAQDDAPQGSSPSAPARIERIPVKRLLNDADASVNFILHGGEQIRVPEASRVFVVGNVHKPGGFIVKEESDTSVLRMVALSEGLLPFSTKLAYIYRRDENGVKQEIPVELDKIMLRKSPDVALQANDVLYIPDNRTKRNVSSALERITNFGASTASGMLIWR
jgi:polysaccharide export outer membrane protein